MENITKKRGRKIGNHAKWNTPKYHIEIKGFGNNPNIIVGDFCNRNDAGDALSRFMGIQISGMMLYNIERKRSQRLAHEILITII